MNTSQLLTLTTFVLLSIYSLALLRRLLAKRVLILRRARR